ncbi:MAG: hypothetical protein WBV23_16310 [Desulfobaccales bacterium]
MKLGIIPKNIFIILLTVNLLSCGGQNNPEEQAKILFTSLQNHNIEKCIEMAYAYQVNLAKIQDEPQFKKEKLIEKNRNEIRTTIFNQYELDNIAYIFRFPCQWQIVEIKNINQESPGELFSNISSINRVFVVVAYKSIDNSPESVPLINNDYKSKFKIREIILHCDFDPDSGLYMRWGLEKYTQW